MPSDSPEEAVGWGVSTELPYEIKSRHAGVIQGVAENRLVHFAQRNDLVLEVTRCVGSFVPLGSQLLRSSRLLDEEQQAEALSHVATGTERTLEQDIAYGFRELTDIALRALSPAMNDVTTAGNVIDAQHDLLLRMGRRADRPTVHADDRGLPRLITRPVSWDVYLHMVFCEIGFAGKEYERIGRHLADVAADLIRELPIDRADAVRRVAPMPQERSAP